MNEGLVPLCSDLGQSAEHSLLRWMSRRARKGGTLQGVVPMDYMRLVARARRDGHPGAQEALRHLFDGGYIEKIEYGDSFSFEVVVRCPGHPEEVQVRDSSQKNSIEDVANRCAAGARGDSLVPEALDGNRGPGGLSGTGAAGGGSGENARTWTVSQVVHLCHPSARNSDRPKKPETKLAQEVFPQLLRENRFGVIFPQHDWMGLVHGLRSWHDRYEISYDQVPGLMREFVKHPEWCRRSKRAPWQVFLSRRQDLINLMASQRQQDPGSRSFQAGRSWNQRPARASSPA